jgi:hypothetical protein
VLLLLHCCGSRSPSWMQQRHEGASTAARCMWHQRLTDGQGVGSGVREGQRSSGNQSGVECCVSTAASSRWQGSVVHTSYSSCFELSKFLYKLQCCNLWPYSAVVQ